MIDKPPTLKDVAKHAGVSTMTVSRVFRDDNAVRPATKELVKKAALDLGYELDHNLGRAMTLRKLRRTQGRAGTIAFLRCIDNDKETAEKFPGVSATDMRVEAERLGFGLDLFEVENNLKAVRHLRKVLVARGIRAVIIVPQVLDHAIREFNFDGFHPVVVGYGLAEPDLSRVCTGVMRSVKECVAMLAASGKKRIGLSVSKFEDERVNFGFSAGYLAGVRHLAGNRQEAVLWTDNILKKDRATKILSWATKHDLDGILSTVRLPAQDSAIPFCVSLDWTKEWDGHPGLDHQRSVVVAQAVNQCIISLTHNAAGLPATPLTVLIPPRLLGFDTAT